MYAAKPKRIFLFGTVKGYALWLITWFILLLCVRHHFLITLVISFVFGMAVGLMIQFAVDAGKTVSISNGMLYYGRSDHMKSFSLEDDMFITSFVQFSPCLQPIRLQTIVLRDGDLQKVISFNFLSRKDFTDMCSKIV